MPPISYALNFLSPGGRRKCKGALCPCVIVVGLGAIDSGN